MYLSITFCIAKKKGHLNQMNFATKQQTHTKHNEMLMHTEVVKSTDYVDG